MSIDKRNRGIGGDQAGLSPFVTDKPIAETIPRRGQDGYLRAQRWQLSEGVLQLFQHILTFPDAFPANDTFLGHTAGGILAWLPAGAISGFIDWSQVVNTPASIAGYNILDAYTKLQIQALLSAIDFSDTGFGSPIQGVASRSQLPPQIAYEDETNAFSQDNTFQQLVIVAKHMRRGIKTITGANSPYTWASGDWHLNADPDYGSVEVKLPLAADYFDSNRTDQIHVKRIGRSTTQTVVLTPQSGEEIDGYDSAVIRERNRCYTLVSDGSDWWIQ